MAPATGSLRTPVLWGVAFGVVQVAVPLGIWWLDAATGYALSLPLIAAVYIGFAVADGRTRILVAETLVLTVFVVIAAAAVTGSAWLLVLGFFGHGVKDLWQHRTQFVANTRWWPPFCLVIDFIAAAVIALMIVGGFDFRA